MRDELRKFIVDSFLCGREDHVFSDEDSFLENGLIDSSGVLELVAFLGDKYGIQVTDKDLVPENLDSINSLIGFVQRKQVAAP